MGKAVQYYNGSNWQQFGITTADITSLDGGVFTIFNVIKDSNDNTYIWCGFPDSSKRGRIIKVDRSGNKTYVNLNWNYTASSTNSGATVSIFLNRAEDEIWYYGYYTGTNSKILVTAFGDINTRVSRVEIGLETANPRQIGIYQDRYIWVSVGSTVYIYDYDTKAELASVNLIGDWQGTTGISCSADNTLYIIGRSTYYGLQISKFEFNGVNIFAKTDYSITDNFNTKQLLIDRFGDLIILTNSGSASTLLKYTTTGVQIGTTLVLGGAFYNLNTDRVGNYYYSNALGTYKITANTAQGQAFTGTGTLIRSSGMTTYGNNITNFNPSVFG